MVYFIFMYKNSIFFKLINIINYINTIIITDIYICNKFSFILIYIFEIQIKLLVGIRKTNTKSVITRDGIEYDFAFF